MNIVEPPNHPVHIGIDVAKASLQIDLQGKSHKLPNTKAGHQTLLGLLPEDAFIIMESTGSYHIAPMECFQAAGIPVAIVNPVRVKQFGKARGTLAKTDPVDAALLTDFGRAFLPSPTPPRDTERVLLGELVNDSGKHEGKRYIRGGRPRIKRALYLAALSAVRFHPTLKPTYKTLRAAGKPAKVALIAIARKLLVILNAKLKEYYATLAPTH